MSIVAVGGGVGFEVLAALVSAERTRAESERAARRSERSHEETARRARAETMREEAHVRLAGQLVGAAAEAVAATTTALTPIPEPGASEAARNAAARTERDLSTARHISDFVAKSAGAGISLHADHLRARSEDLSTTASSHANRAQDHGDELASLTQQQQRLLDAAARIADLRHQAAMASLRG